MNKGIIKYFNKYTGYGIIEYNDKLYEFRYTDFDNNDYEELDDFVKVEFEIEEGRIVNGNILHR